MANGKTTAGDGAACCRLGNRSVAVGQKAVYQGRLLYCAHPGAWLDYGPADPVTPPAGRPAAAQPQSSLSDR